jgi:hypothetical protein
MAALAASLTLPLALRGEEAAAKEARPAGAVAEPAGIPAKGFEIETAAGREAFPDGALEDLVLRLGGKAAELTIPSRKVPLDDIVFLRFPPRAAAPAALPDAPLVLFLRDGSELAGRVTAGDEDSVRFRVPGLGAESLAIPIEKVKGLMVLSQEAAPGAPPGSRPRERTLSRGAWRIRLRSEISSARAEKDEVILLQEGRVQGILESLDAEGVRFGSDTLGDLKIGYEKLRALILAEVDLPEAKRSDSSPSSRDEKGKKAAGSGRSMARITLQDGSSFAASLKEIAGGRVSLEHDILGTLSAALADVLDVAFLGGKTRYLSDVEPSAVKEHLGPAFQKKMPFRRDANVLGEPLRMGGREYRKGLGVHSYSRLEFDLGGEYTRFQATIGLDESARPFESQSPAADVGHVIFRVRVDGNQMLEKAMSWRDAPAAIDLPVAGGRQLALEVDFGPAEGSGPGFNFARDRANWAEARIIR